MSIKNIARHLKTQTNIEFCIILEVAMQLQNDSDGLSYNPCSHQQQEYLR